MGEIVDVDLDEYHKQLREEILSSEKYTSVEIIIPTLKGYITKKEDLETPYISIKLRDSNSLTVAVVLCALDKAKEDLLKLEGVKELYEYFKGHRIFGSFMEGGDSNK